MSSSKFFIYFFKKSWPIIYGIGFSYFFLIFQVANIPMNLGFILFSGINLYISPNLDIYKDNYIIQVVDIFKAVLCLLSLINVLLFALYCFHILPFIFFYISHIAALFCAGFQAVITVIYEVLEKYFIKKRVEKAITALMNNRPITVSKDIIYEKIAQETFDYIQTEAEREILKAEILKLYKKFFETVENRLRGLMREGSTRVNSHNFLFIIENWQKQVILIMLEMAKLEYYQWVIDNINGILKEQGKINQDYILKLSPYLYPAFFDILTSELKHMYIISGNDPYKLKIPKNINVWEGAGIRKSMRLFLKEIINRNLNLVPFISEFFNPKTLSGFINDKDKRFVSLIFQNIENTIKDYCSFLEILVTILPIEHPIMTKWAWHYSFWHCVDILSCDANENILPLLFSYVVDILKVYQRALNDPSTSSELRKEVEEEFAKNQLYKAYFIILLGRKGNLHQNTKKGNLDAILPYIEAWDLGGNYEALIPKYYRGYSKYSPKQKSVILLGIRDFYSFGFVADSRCKEDIDFFSNVMAIENQFRKTLPSLEVSIYIHLVNVFLEKVNFGLSIQKSHINDLNNYNKETLSVIFELSSIIPYGSKYFFYQAFQKFVRLTFQKTPRFEWESQTFPKVYKGDPKNLKSLTLYYKKLFNWRSCQRKAMYFIIISYASTKLKASLKAKSFSFEMSLQSKFSLRIIKSFIQMNPEFKDLEELISMLYLASSIPDVFVYKNWNHFPYNIAKVLEECKGEVDKMEPIVLHIKQQGIWQESLKKELKGHILKIKENIINCIPIFFEKFLNFNNGEFSLEQIEAYLLGLKELSKKISSKTNFLKCKNFYGLSITSGRAAKAHRFLLKNPHYYFKKPLSHSEKKAPGPGQGGWKYKRYSIYGYVPVNSLSITTEKSENAGETKQSQVLI